MFVRRLAIAISWGVVASFLLAGCATSPGSVAPSASSAPPSSPRGDDRGDDFGDLEATLLDEGRMFAIVSWGSSTCIPQVDDVSANGQNVAVTLVDPEGEGDAEKVCSADLAARASVAALPQGVDPTREITLQVSYGGRSDDVDLDGMAEAAGADPATEYLPSAGWFGDGGLVLLTWGSSSCPPVVESVEAMQSAGTVTFATDEKRPCTKDMAPRATIIQFDDDSIDDDVPFTLTLVGGALDGTLEVR